MPSHCRHIAVTLPSPWRYRSARILAADADAQEEAEESDGEEESDVEEGDECDARWDEEAQHAQSAVAPLPFVSMDKVPPLGSAVGA